MAKWQLVGLVRLSRRLCLFCLLCPVPIASLAHHSRAAFDLDAQMSVTGVVTEVAWTNPHYYLSVLAPTAAGPQQWTFEGHSVPGLVRNGWSKNTIEVGQQVEVVANPNRDEAVRFGLLDYVTRPDGRTFYSFRPAPETRLEPAEPVIPSTDFSGTWRLIRSLRSNLVGGFDAPTDWPLTEQAQAQAASYSMHNDPSLRCEERGLPRMLQWPYAQRWQWQDGQLVIVREHSEEGRVVSATALDPTDTARSKSGVSQYSHLDDGSLMIETVGFVATEWGNTRGVDSSAMKSLTEYYTLSEDGLVLELRYTVADPEYLTEPVTGTASYAKVADFHFAPEPPCDTYTAQRHLQFEADKE